MDLTNLFQSDPAAQELGLKQIGDERAQMAARLQDMLQQTQQRAQVNPLLLKQQELANQTTQAQMPGLEAQSSMQADRANISRSTIGQQLEEAMRKHRTNMTDADFKEIGQTGQAFSQVGEYLSGIPVPARHAAAKQMLGQMYRPEFDNYNPNDLVDTLQQTGKWMNEAATKFQMQQAGIMAKTGSAERIASEKNAAEIEKAKIAATAKTAQYTKEFIELKAKFGNYPQQSAFYNNKALEVAQAMGDASEPEQKAHLREMANVYSQMAHAAQQQEVQKAVAAAIEANKAKPDLNPLGIPTVTPPNGNNPVAAPSTQTPMGSPEAFKQAFGTYEPDKYEYRMGPNGPQRRKKQ